MNPTPTPSEAPTETESGPTEPQQQCYELMAHCKATAAELTQARFENEALRRRLAEYAGEVQRLRDRVKEMRCALEQCNELLIHSKGLNLPSYTATQHVQAAIIAALNKPDPLVELLKLQ
jgi:predicted nuclease with TOPRIM domain